MIIFLSPLFQIGLSSDLQIVSMDETARIMFQCQDKMAASSSSSGFVDLEEILPHLELEERLEEKADEMAASSSLFEGGGGRQPPSAESKALLVINSLAPLSFTNWLDNTHMHQFPN